MGLDLGSPEIGNLAGLVTGVAAVGGLIFAGLEVKKSAEQRRDDQNRRAKEEKDFMTSMARAVGIDVRVVGEVGDLGALQVSVHNAGRYPIEKVELFAAIEPIDPEILIDVPEAASRHPLGTLLPGGQKTAGPAGAKGVDPEDVPIAVTFVDTWDQRWVKIWKGTLYRVGGG